MQRIDNVDCTMAVIMPRLQYITFYWNILYIGIDMDENVWLNCFHIIQAHLQFILS